MTDISAPSNQGTRWSADDDAKLTAGLREMQGTLSARFHLLAEMLGRSKGSVESRAQLLDLLDYGRYTPLITAKEPRKPKAAKLEDPENEATEPARPVFDPWLEADTARLLIAHEIGDDLAPLAQQLNRSPRALALKLVSLGKVVPTLKDNPTPPPSPTPNRAEAERRPTRSVTLHQNWSRPPPRAAPKLPSRRSFKRHSKPSPTAKTSSSSAAPAPEKARFCAGCGKTSPSKNASSPSWPPRAWRP